MATHDYIISNASGAAVRADLNNALAAIATNNSSATEPTTTYAYQWWADTGSSPTVMKLRNAANSGWITLFQLDGEWTVVPFENGTAAAPSIYFKDSGTDTGIYSPGTDQVGISAGGTSRFEVSTSATTSTLPVVHPLGAVGTPSITFTGDLNTGIWSPAADTVAVSTNGTRAITIDSSQRLGIGVTTPQYASHINATKNTTSLFITTDSVGSAQDYSQIGFGNKPSGNEIFAAIRHSYDNPGAGAAGALRFYTHTGSVLNERVAIDSSGRLLVGTSSAQGQSIFQAVGNSSASTDPGDIRVIRGLNISAIGTNVGAELGIIRFGALENSVCAQISAVCDANWSANDTPGRLVFSTTADGAASPTERMRIHSTGNTSIGGGALFGGLTDPGSSVKILSTVIGSGAGTHFIKWSNVTGNLSYDTSSRLIKEDIIDCPYGIAEVKQLKPRKYFRTDDQANEIGFIADEVVDLMPEFVPVGPKSVITRNDEDTEEIPLGVNYDKLTAVLTKALQEAIAKIETLEAKVAALESA